MRDVGHAFAVRASGAIRQGQIAAHHLLLGAVIELLVLRQIGLHDAQPHAGHEAGRCLVQPDEAIRRASCQNEGRT